MGIISLTDAIKFYKKPVISLTVQDPPARGGVWVRDSQLTVGLPLTHLGLGAHDGFSERSRSSLFCHSSGGQVVKASGALCQRPNTAQQLLIEMKSERLFKHFISIDCYISE